VTCYELQFCAKDWYFARESRVIGVGVCQLKSITKRVRLKLVLLVFYNRRNDEAGIRPFVVKNFSERLLFLEKIGIRSNEADEK